jgi:two-component system sensor histidine kinase YesM
LILRKKMWISMNFKLPERFRFRSFRLSFKLIVTYILLTVIPMSLIGYIAYFQYTKSIEEQFGEYMPQYLTLANTNIDQRMMELTNLPELIYSSNDMITIFRKSDYGSQSEMLQDQFKVNNYLARTYINGNNPDIIGVFMVTKEAVFSSTRMNYTGFDLAYQPQQYGGDLELSGNAKIILPSEVDLKFEDNIPYIIVMKKVADFDNRKSLGTMYIAVQLSFIDEILGDFENKERADLWIMNTQGLVIYHTDKEKIGTHDQEITRYPVMNGSFRSNKTDEPQLISINESRQFNWVLAHSIPLKYLTERTDLARNVTVLAFIVFALITSVLSIFLALNVSRPIKKLSGLMKHVEMGNFQVDLKVQSYDEVGVLARSFNSMIATIRNLIQKNYFIEIKQKEAELYALQAQINPHFMYNTLETIGMAVEEGETELVVEMVTLLGQMLRFSLSNHDKLVRIEAEVQHIQDYLTIQKYRFEDRVQFNIAIKSGVHQIYTPKFILQPIVENSIKYGLESRKGIDIQIVINKEFSARTGMDEIVFRIRDNGPGISPERMAEITELLRADPLAKVNSGFGLKNVHARIAMMFGDQYGLQLDTIEGLGTEIILRIPIIATVNEKLELEAQEVEQRENQSDDRR